MIKTNICDLLGIEYPIFQGAMAWISDAELAAAVSEGGGLGIIAAGHAPGEYVREQIHKARTLTNKPFGVNIMLLSPHAEAVAQVLAEEEVAAIITGAGNPAKYMKSWQHSKVIPVVPSTALAKMMARSGASAVIVEGSESGGHIGELATMPLVPQVCDVVDIPVVAAGGIGDGRGIMAAFMLGATGVQVGTRFILAKECNAHQHYKNLVLKAKDIDTIATGKRLGHPVRALKNPFLREFSGKEYDSSISNEELEKFGEGALKLAAIDGDLANGCFMAGQISGMFHKEQTAREIIVEMFAQAEEVIKQWQKI
ncbi:MAG: nitronate monooxygenase [Defluviitaleaceae bacterium]|nr:nitronate monooxygenase [Defluviitaleaceae bacterium]